MSTTRSTTSTRLLIIAVLAAVLAALVGAVGAAEASPTSSSSGDDGRAERSISSRAVTFRVVNRADTIALSCGNDRGYRLRAQLVGPTRAVRGHAALVDVNVLLHDEGTGGWFWDGAGTPSRGYARQLAQRGETSLVLDRLGFGRSRLGNGDATCLGAQTSMVHQVVQHLLSGNYQPVRGHAAVPHASAVRLHGHGTGATLAQLEAEEYDDVQGLVLMSVPTPQRTDLTSDILSGQLAACRTDRSYAPFGTAAQFRRALFASAPASVQKRAVRLRGPSPCGDVTTGVAAVTTSGLSARSVEVPVLVLSGARDRRAQVMSRADARSRFSGAPRVAASVVRGAGSALPLEAQAGRVERRVARWLGTL